MSVKIKRIYFGVNYGQNDEEVISKIKKSCENNNVEMKYMCLSEKNYALKLIGEHGKKC